MVHTGPLLKKMKKKKNIQRTKTLMLVLDLRELRFGNSKFNNPMKKMHFLSEGFQQKSLGFFESRNT